MIYVISGNRREFCFYCDLIEIPPHRSLQYGVKCVMTYGDLLGIPVNSQVVLYGNYHEFLRNHHNYEHLNYLHKTGVKVFRASAMA